MTISRPALSPRPASARPRTARSRDLLVDAPLLDRPVEYVDHPLFHRPKAAMLLESRRPASLATLESGEPASGPLSGAFLAGLTQLRLLSVEEEEFLFAWMNFQKFQAETLRLKAVGGKARGDVTAELETLLAEATRTRNLIVRANLRLVIALAKKTMSNGQPLGELVSDGVLPLIRSVELFDVSLGNRFSTYATWAVRNHLFRVVRRHRTAAEKIKVRGDAGLEQLPAVDGGRPTEVEAEARWQELNGWLSQLEGRERAIVEARFGLSGQPAGRSLADIATDFGLSKERVRQIVLKAVDRLQQFAAA